MLEPAYRFQTEGTPVTAEAFGNGHINGTYKIVTDTGKIYVLQRINSYVFKEPFQVMANICAVTEHLRKKGGENCLHFLPTAEGAYCFRDEQGEYWRLCDYVDGFCLDAPEQDEDLYESALAFGRFQEDLADFPAETLYETIPDFHNTPSRFRQLRESAAADLKKRADSCREETAYAWSLEEKCSTLQAMLDGGKLPLRVTHNDTKLNNVMLDRKTRKALCVLDLDTVMPGLSLYDYGDAIRFGAATCAEDDPDPRNMRLNENRFRIYTRGYLEAVPSLTSLEKEMLPLGALTMTAEVGIRFLKDYLDGDVYFKTAYPEHNLVRARTQFALAQDMLAQWGKMNGIVEELTKPGAV